MLRAGKSSKIQPTCRGTPSRKVMGKRIGSSFPNFRLQSLKRLLQLYQREEKENPRAVFSCGASAWENIFEQGRGVSLLEPREIPQHLSSMQFTQMQRGLSQVSPWPFEDLPDQVNPGKDPFLGRDSGSGLSFPMGDQIAQLFGLPFFTKI